MRRAAIQRVFAGLPREVRERLGPEWQRINRRSRRLWVGVLVWFASLVLGLLLAVLLLRWFHPATAELRLLIVGGSILGVFLPGTAAFVALAIRHVEPVPVLRVRSPREPGTLPRVRGGGEGQVRRRIGHDCPPGAQPVSTPTLDYANPAVFFAGVHRQRTPARIIASTLACMFGLGFWWLALEAPGPGDHGIVLRALALFSLLLGGGLGLAAALNLAHAVRITADGIEHGRRFWPWRQVTHVSGARHLGGVAIHFKLGSGGTHQLSTTPRLSAHEFQTIAEALQTYLSREHPRVKVDPQPRRMTD